jgi:pyruvate ferredoxin oxidoreductase delta subunit
MFNIPKDKEVPLGCVTPAPVNEQPMMITGNWREFRPVLEPEKCDLCMNCVVFCPDASFQLDESGEKVVLNEKYCKGCNICITECAPGALTAVHELDFDDGVVRLDKPF